MSFVSKITLPNNESYDLKDKLANLYATCDTAAATATKEITLSGFEAVNGVTIHVTFTYGNTATAPQLSINSGAAVGINCLYDNLGIWDAGETVAFTYDGIHWRANTYAKVEVIRL